MKIQSFVEENGSFELSESERIEIRKETTHINIVTRSFVELGRILHHQSMISIRDFSIANLFLWVVPLGSYFIRVFVTNSID